MVGIVSLKRKEIGDKPSSEMHADHELFLQAFEKPTQIYRYLRSRNVLCPIFLQRTLYYMKGRMSRGHKNRSTFKLDSLLEKLSKKVEKPSDSSASFLDLNFAGFFDNKVDGHGDTIARVETFVVKMCHKKRKESSAAQMPVSFGTQDVQINPTGGSDSGGIRNPILSIPAHTLSVNSGPQVKSYVLTFRVVLTHDQENGEPQHKRRRVSRVGTVVEETASVSGELVGTCYTAEMVIFDRHGRCLLTAGQYELILDRQANWGDAERGSKSPKKLMAIWEPAETIRPDENFFGSLPLLKFSLNWNNGSANNAVTAIQRPRLRPLKPLDVALANDASTKPKTQGVVSPEAPQLVLYQFVYNNNSRQQTESRSDFHCPWCSINCIALYSLLKHLKLSHARFSFTYMPHPKGARLDVSLNECHDGSYGGNPQDLLVTAAGFAFSRSGPTRRSPTTSILVCRPKRPKASLSEFLLEQDDNDFDLPRSYILGHNRLYYHTKSCIPIQAHELDEDSEGEHDSEWVRQKTQTMIDEFSDVNEGEKELMKMWNLHVMKHNFVGDGQISLACSMFIEAHGTELLCRNLYRNFVLHLTSLVDFGIIGSGIVYNCVMLLQAKMRDPETQQHVLTNFREYRQSAKRLFAVSKDELKIEVQPTNPKGEVKKGLAGEKSVSKQETTCLTKRIVGTRNKIQ